VIAASSRSISVEWEVTLETIIEGFAFAGFLATQFLGVVAVHGARFDNVDNPSSRSPSIRTNREVRNLDSASRIEARLTVRAQTSADREKHTDEGEPLGYDSRDIGGWRCNLGFLGHSGERSTPAF